MFRKTLRESLHDIRLNKIDYLFLFFQFLVFVGPIRQFIPDNFLFVNLFIILLISAIKRRLQLSADFFILSIVYLLIIIIPLFTFDTGLRIYIGFYIRLISAYFIIKYFSIRFFGYFENLVFILALISLPLFTIQIINPRFFEVFNSLSNAVLDESRLRVGPDTIITHKYLFVYLLNGWAINRNSGFAWEPAAFGAMLSWALLFNFFINKFKLNLKSVIFFIAALTTFSLGTYSYLFLLAIFFILVRRLKYSLYLISGIFLIFFTVWNLPFIQENIVMMKEKSVAQTENASGVLPEKSDINSVNRVAGIYINMAYFLKWPWGYGFADNEGDRKLLGSSPNGIMIMVVRWGIAGIIIILLGAFKIIKLVQQIYFFKVLTKLEVLIAMLIFLLPFSGNPFYNKPVSLALILFGFFISVSVVKAKKYILTTDYVNG